MKSLRSMLLGITLILIGIFIWLLCTVPFSLGFGEIVALILIAGGLFLNIAVAYINKDDN